MSQSSRYARGKRHASTGGELEPLSRRLLEVAGVLSLLLALVIVNSFLHEGDASPLNPNPVAAAAERTAEASGMRIAMTLRVKSEAGPLATITGDGVYNGATNLAEVTYDTATPQGQHMPFDAILGEHGWYFRYPQFADRMPAGKEWVKLEGLPGQKDLSAPGVGSPDESLQMLRSVGAVHRLGHARVGKVRVTRYRVAMSPAQLADSLDAQGKDELAQQMEEAAPQLTGPLRGEVLIDGDGVLRRMRLTSTGLEHGRRVTATVTMSFSHFGIEPNVLVPDDSRVLDITPLLEKKLEALGQAS